MRFGNLFKNPLGIAVKIIIKICPFIICPISSCHGSRKVKRLFDFTTVLPACELASRCYWQQLGVHCLQQRAYREDKFDVTLPWWQNFWISTICLDRDGRKKSMGYWFVLECNPAQESHTCPVFAFFLPCLQDNVCWGYTNFATMATWHNDFSSLFERTIVLHHHHSYTHRPYRQLSLLPFMQVHILQTVSLHLLLYKRWEICLF